MIVIPAVEQTEVFGNESGTITIRQTNAFEQTDHLIVISPEHVPAICKALREAAKTCRDIL